MNFEYDDNVAQYTEREIHKVHDELVAKGFDITCSLVFGSVVSGNIKDPDKNFGQKSDVDMLVIAKDASWPEQYSGSSPRMADLSKLEEDDREFAGEVFGSYIYGYTYTESGNEFPSNIPLSHVSAMVYSEERVIYELQALQTMLNYNGNYSPEKLHLFRDKYSILFIALTQGVLIHGDMPEYIQDQVLKTHELLNRR